MIEVVENFLNKYGLLNTQKTILVGFSGGYDSLCLLHVLLRLSSGFKNLVAVHLNHNWRDAESMTDEQNCKKFCFENNIEFYSELVEKPLKKNELEARNIRYDFFSRCAIKFKADVVFTAHTKTDNAETVLYRIIKGTGIKGLEGILEHRGIFYRPLLEVSRADTIDYCKFHELSPNIDSSNFDDKYKRNFIRNKIFNLFDEINPHAENAFVSLAKVASDETKIVDEYIDFLERNLRNDFGIITSEFVKLSEQVQRKLIYNMFLDNNLEYDREKVLRIFEFIQEYKTSHCGSKISLTKDLWLFVNSENIEIIKKKNLSNIEVKINGEGEYNFLSYKFKMERFNTEGLSKFFGDKELKALVDLSDFKDCELTLRTRRDGDFIQPLGMSGTMKFKKYLGSKKISQPRKDKYILLCKGNEILWASGLGLSDKIKVVNKSTHVLSLRKV